MGARVAEAHYDLELARREAEESIEASIQPRGSAG